MKLKPIGSNQTVLETKDFTVLFSYSTPVAVRVMGKGINKIIKTRKFHSNTTSKHINAWIKKEIGFDFDSIEVIEQEDLDKMIEKL